MNSLPWPSPSSLNSPSLPQNTSLTARKNSTWVKILHSMAQCHLLWKKEGAFSPQGKQSCAPCLESSVQQDLRNLDNLMD